MFGKGVEFPKSEFFHFGETPFNGEAQYDVPIFVGGFVNGELQVIEYPEYFCECVGRDVGQEEGERGRRSIVGLVDVVSNKRSEFGGFPSKEVTVDLE